MKRHLRSHAVATNVWIVVYWLLENRLNARQSDIASHHGDPKHVWTVAVWILDDSAAVGELVVVL